MTQFKTPGSAQGERETTNRAEPEYSQVLGFLLLRSVGADLTAAGGSGAQLRGEEERETLHHRPLDTERRPRRPDAVSFVG